MLEILGQMGMSKTTRESSAPAIKQQPTPNGWVDNMNDVWQTDSSRA